MWLWMTLACGPELAPDEGCGTGRLCVVAGVPGLGGARGDEWPATETWLYQPEGLTPAAGGFYVADTNNHVVRWFGDDGSARVVAGSGFPDFGNGGPARLEPLHGPVMVVPDPADPATLWIALPAHHQIGRLRDGIVDYPYGTGDPWFSGDGGPAALAEFDRPAALAFDEDGAMYVADRMNQVVRRIDPDGTVATIAGTPGEPGDSGDGGPADQARLNAPYTTAQAAANRIAVADGRLWIADTGNGAIRVVDLGSGVITTAVDGLDQPYDVQVDVEGGVWISETGAGCVRRLDPDGSLATVAGHCGDPGPISDGAPLAEALLGRPTGLALGPDGALWITDEQHHVVLRAGP